MLTNAQYVVALIANGKEAAKFTSSPLNLRQQ
jgi:hypothetical protein